MGGMKESTYDVVLCGRCANDQHEDCDGVAVLKVGDGYFYGSCQCKHSRIKSKGDSALSQRAGVDADTQAVRTVVRGTEERK